jgi:hypothetical protein
MSSQADSMRRHCNGANHWSAYFSFEIMREYKYLNIAY